MADNETKATIAKIVVTRATFRSRVTMGEWIAIMENNQRVANRVMARFAVDDAGQPISEEDAFAALLDLNIEDNEKFAAQFKEGMTSAAVPLENERS